MEDELRKIISKEFKTDYHKIRLKELEKRPEGIEIKW